MRISGFTTNPLEAMRRSNVYEEMEQRKVEDSMPEGMYNPINDPVAAALAARLGTDAGSIGIAHVGVKSRVPGDPGSPLRRGGVGAGTNTNTSSGAEDVVPNANFRGPTSYRNSQGNEVVGEPSLDGAAAVEARISIALARRKLGNR